MIRMLMDLFEEIIKKTRFKEFFARLAVKLADEPHRRERTTGGSKISPGWMLLNENEITRKVIREIKSKKYFPEPAHFQLVRLDKDRRLFSLGWIDRLVDSVLASSLSDAIEPHLSNRLFSFRKGRGNFQVVKEFGDYVSNNLAKGSTTYVVKLDVSKYGDSIDRNILMNRITELIGPQDDYISKLLESFFHPTKALGEDDVLAEKGVPTGFSLCPVSENIYLSALDNKIDKIPRLFYSRFGDDILLASADKEILIRADKQVAENLLEYKLSAPEEKRQTLSLGESSFGNKEQDFGVHNSVDYLGFSINFEGKLFLSNRKEKELKKDFRMTAKKAALANRKLGKQRQLDMVIRAVSLHLEREFRHPYLEMTLRIINDSERLKKLDVWVAKVCLRYIYGTGHDRVFRYKSLKDLRAMGLPSIVHIKNTLRRLQKSA